jgi:hypothetical protein
MMLMWMLLAFWMLLQLMMKYYDIRFALALGDGFDILATGS